MDLTQKKILIVEDDPIYTIWLKMVLEDYGITQIVCETNVKQAIEVYQSNPPDLLICDVFLEGKLTGIDLLKQLQAYQIPIIVITNSRDKALYDNVKKVQYVNYLVKPFQPLSLISVIENVFHEIDSSKNSKLKESYILVKNFENVNVKMYLSDIIYLESDKNYTYIYSSDKKVALKKSLVSLLPDLDNNFIRIHKSFIVNKIYVNGWNSQTVTLSNGSSITIGRTYFKDFASEMENRILPT
jgi:two-component system, LytTR family, response regulator LytT